MAYDKAFVVVTCACEASGEPREARLGVIFSIINRQKCGRFGKTLAAVCLKRYQYSEWNADPIDNRNLERVAELSDGDATILEISALYDEVMEGAADPTGGATHYHDSSISPPTWTDGATLSAVLGRLHFYSGVA